MAGISQDWKREDDDDVEADQELDETVSVRNDNHSPACITMPPLTPFVELQGSKRCHYYGD